MTSAYGGDNGPEGLIYIAPENTTTGKGYVIVANEISGTLSMYEVANAPTLATGEKSEKATFNVFPNPVTKEIRFISTERRDMNCMICPENFLEKRKCFNDRHFKIEYRSVS
jgi:hypothetical protein